jgi:ubiquinone/menaquinone biosynthesis C-methylase UbiE
VTLQFASEAAMEAVYDEIGEGYDTTRKADPGILTTLSSLLDIEEEKRYLDAACGTGNYTAGISRFGGKWFAFDNSERMLSEARLKSSQVDWKQWEVTRLGYQSDFFDGAMCSLAIHHFPELNKAFREIARVLKRKSKFVIFTATQEQMRSYWLNHYFPKMMEYSCKQMPTFEAIQTALAQANFSIESTEPFFISPELHDFFLYSGKQRPEIYLSSNVRNGISSFHNFCTQSELDGGLGKLCNDIDSGEIKEIMNRYNNDNGDYVFICANAR